MNATERLIDMITGMVQARALAAALQLGVFDALDTQALNLAELAAQLPVDERHLRAIVAFLASKGIIRLDGDRYRLANEFRPLLGVGAPAREVVQFECYSSLPALHRMDRLLLDNSMGFDLPFFSDTAPLEHERAIQHGFLLASEGAAERLAQALEPISRNAASILDVGSGLGQYCIPIIDHAREATAWLLDRPRVLDLAAQFLARRSPQNFQAGRFRIDHSCHDFFDDEFPAMADLILVSRVLHDWDDDHCVLLLKQCRRFAAQGAHLVIHEEILRSDLCGPDYAAVNGLYLSYSLPGARNRTLEELTRLLDKSGWGTPRTLAFDDGNRFAILVCNPAQVGP